MEIENFEGLRALPQRWMPTTYGELWKEYERHIDLVFEASQFLPESERRLAASAIISNGRGLLHIGPIAPRLVDILTQYAQNELYKEAVVKEVEETLHYDRKSLPEDITKRLDELNRELTQESFAARTRRHAGLKLVQDNFDEAGNHIEIPSALIRLADEARESPNSLALELPWLVTDSAKNGFIFGLLLGQKDDLSLWTAIKRAWIDAGKNRSDYFLGGYLAGLFRQDEGLWELVIGELFCTCETSQELATLVWRSGMSDTVASALYERVELGELAPREFRMMVYGGVTQQLPLRVIKGVLDKLICSGDPEDANSALDILQSRLHSNDAELSDFVVLLERVLNHPTFVVGHDERITDDNMRDWRWTQGALKLLKIAPDRAVRLAHACIVTFGDSGSVTDSYFSGSWEFFDSVVEQRPEEMWRQLAKRLEGKFSARKYTLLQWLRGRRADTHGGDGKPSGFELLPTDAVMKWVAKDPDHRGPLIAQYCPPHISLPGETQSLARAVLETFGVNSEIRSALHANFFTGVFWGPASAHYDSKMLAVRSRITEETNPLVRIWFEEEAERLEHAAQAEREREEADQ